MRDPQSLFCTHVFKMIFFFCHNCEFITLGVKWIHVTKTFVVKCAPIHEDSFCETWGASTISSAGWLVVSTNHLQDYYSSRVFAGHAGGQVVTSLVGSDNFPFINFFRRFKFGLEILIYFLTCFICILLKEDWSICQSESQNLLKDVQI